MPPDEILKKFMISEAPATRQGFPEFVFSFSDTCLLTPLKKLGMRDMKPVNYYHFEKRLARQGIRSSKIFCANRLNQHTLSFKDLQKNISIVSPDRFR